MSDQEQTTPSAVFLDVQHKVENGHNYQAADTRIDFQRLFTALRSALAENESLKAEIKASDVWIQEQEIVIFNKDIELFNAITQFDSLKDIK